MYMCIYIYSYQEERPWRKAPDGFIDKGKPKSNVPKYVDPDVTMDLWKKRWELKILNDPDLKVMRVKMGNNGERRGGHAASPPRSPSPQRRDASSRENTLSPVGDDGANNASVQSLTAVHLIRENQRARIKQYNQSLVSTPTPSSARKALSPHHSHRATSAGPSGGVRGGKSPGIARGASQDPPLSARNHPRQDTSSFDAATRHILRQRTALAARSSRSGARSPYRAKSEERARASGGHDSYNAYTPELSNNMRAAGTAAMAKRGVKPMIGSTPRSRPSPEGAGALGLGEKFHMLEAHLRKATSVPTDSSLDLSGLDGSHHADRSVDSPAVEYLFKADVPKSGVRVYI